ncbi:30S ribosomal protein S4 [uncultured Parvimonas sp.]|mgnify:FL=1|uniref:30S ribosomal protein S4 n=1 Tax=uncultured Parvimonas sp. TaxID=747372 RepID=UPI002805F452|nr:30S ribosomal protein S4 [uncultured Parvimonas sp.]
MARYLGPTYKKSRRFGFSVLENGKELAKKPYAPGEHGQDRRKKLSNYGVQLQEKQKVKFMYGLSEKQMEKTFEKAVKMKGVNGENLLKLLESRLDNLVYRIGFATTRKGARQLVNHGHVTVNGKRVDIPSYQVKPGDVISLMENDKEMAIVKSSLEALHNRVEYISYDDKKMEATYVRMPERSELNADIDEALIIEYYNRN